MNITRRTIETVYFTPNDVEVLSGADADLDDQPEAVVLDLREYGGGLVRAVMTADLAKDIAGEIRKHLGVPGVEHLVDDARELLENDWSGAADDAEAGYALARSILAAAGIEGAPS